MIAMGSVRRRAFLRGLAGLAAGGMTSSGCSPADSSPVGPTPGPTPTTAPGQGTGKFPPGFVWGTATSAYQVEGAAAQDGRGPSVWDTFAHQGHAGGDTGDVTADQYHRYRDDVALMKGMGLQSYRFSISWPRVQPTGSGRVNQAGLDYYRRLVDALHQAGIAPMATLWHWDTPQALQDVGGWASRDVAHRFADYAGIVFDRIGADIPTYLTLNEPKTVVQLGYTTGVHAPGLTDPAAATKVMHHLLLGHGLAVSALRARSLTCRIGIALGLAEIQPADRSDRVAGLVRTSDVRENTLYLDPLLRGRYPDALLFEVVDEGSLAAVLKDGDLAIISAPVDLLGVNYYGSATVGGPSRHARAQPADWLEIDPESLYRTLIRLHTDYRDPLISITENGRPNGTGGRVADSERIEFLRGYLQQAQRAIAAGVRLESWHTWSLLDNFEWSEGFRQRWGLIDVDFRTLVRTPKASAAWFSSVARTNSV